MTFFQKTGWLCGLLLAISAGAQPSGYNYDESKVAPYTLPDVLLLPDGKRLNNRSQWEQLQRPHLLRLFTENVYGPVPGPPPGLHFEIISSENQAFNGAATRRQVRIFFGKNGPHLDVLLYLPNAARKPVPVFVGLNFQGNHNVTAEAGIAPSEAWRALNDTTQGLLRGREASRWPIDTLLAHGFGLATAFYGDLEPDKPEGYRTGVRTTLAETLHLNPTDWTAMGAWAWGLSRIMDYLQTDALVNARQVAVVGHSRLGKAALWAAANDARFALVIANESGEGGAALARRNFGETVARINASFPHWFTAKYKTYADDPSQLPVDQHMLLALMAPRPLYVASAEGDQWADPNGEFLATLAAQPAYDVYGRQGVGVLRQPPVNQPVGQVVRYHVRTGKHDLTAYDWQQYIRFAEEMFDKK